MMPELTGDPPSAPLFSVHVEAKAMEALNVLIFVHGGDGAPIQDGQLVHLRVSLTRLVDRLFPFKGDYADFAGPDSLDGSDYIHPIKVAALAVVIGRTMGMPRSALIDLAMTAALMNVGYLALRRSILDEPRRLLDGEWEQHVHTHPDQSAALLARSGLPDDCLQAISQHHERSDGSGYPNRLRGDAICRSARILAVADTYVSLRSLRPYRPAVDADEALREIASDSGTLLDPEVVDAFEDVIARYTGIMRPERATAAAGMAGAAPHEEHSEAQRNGIGSAGDARDPDKPVRDTSDDEDAHDARAGRSADVTPPPERTDAARYPAAAREPAPIRPARSAPAPVAAPARTSTAPALGRAAPAPPAPPPPPARHRARRRARSKPTLFAAGLYVEAAVRGRWASD